MNWESLLLMRSEIGLLAIILLLVIFEIFSNKKQKASIIPFALILLTINTVIGFLPLNTGEIFGGMFRTNALLHLFKTTLSIGVLILLLQSADWLKEKVITENKSTEFLILILSSLLGTYYMISAGDFLMFYIGLELTTLPVAALVAYETFKRKSAEAGVKYILSSALASGSTIFGVSLLYATTGTIYFDAMAEILTISNLSILGFIFFFSGLAFKISLAPFHFWTADVYEGAPINVASYLSVISKGAAVVILMIVLFTVFKPLIPIWSKIIYIIAIATMFVGNLFALRQQNMKRFLAYSSIAQAGFILLGLLSVDQLGATTVVYFVAVYIFSNLGAFGVVQAISAASNKENIDDYEGFYRTNPRLSMVMMLSLFSLAGIPPLAGFFGKFFLYVAAASKGYYILVFIGVVNATISLYYYLLVIRAMFLRKNPDAIPYFKSKPYMKLGLIMAAVGILVAGLYSPLYEYIFSISNSF
ncbi:NADH-quinone oxidoreductase subunit N [Lutibacter profundi]|uniref:NADH-quinone oxidoreductase subunit N n=1 Tax=Lutibacter profundi TaxID=1622118 RepID=A0A0X8G7L9_9FLAO|nr:NADH-quinone oxidoreductase subunit N [Lutibacter profundi]AMC11563.1 NADH-quinone oxidoreductase subunit N [Lutibacter profundi]